VINNLEQFLADYPFKLFIKEEDWFQQTADEAKVIIQKAQAKKERIRLRNRINASGFLHFEPNYRDVDYTSQRGQRRRYQLGRD
jgi:hypothetical protein